MSDETLLPGHSDYKADEPKKVSRTNLTKARLERLCPNTPIEQIFVINVQNRKLYSCISKKWVSYSYVALVASKMPQIKIILNNGTDVTGFYLARVLARQLDIKFKKLNYNDAISLFHRINSQLISK